MKTVRVNRARVVAFVMPAAPWPDGPLTVEETALHDGDVLHVLDDQAAVLMPHAVGALIVGTRAGDAEHWYVVAADAVADEEAARSDEEAG